MVSKSDSMRVLDTLRNRRLAAVKEAQAIAERASRGEKVDEKRYDALNAEIERLGKMADATERDIRDLEDMEAAARDIERKRGNGPREIPEVPALGEGETFRQRLLGNDQPTTVKAFGSWLARAMRSGNMPEMTEAEAREAQTMTGLALPDPDLGSAAVPVGYSLDLIDLAVRQTVLRQAGARFVPMAERAKVLPRITKRPVPTWRLEGAPLGQDHLTVDAVHLRAKNLSLAIKITEELYDDVAALGEAVRREMSHALAIALDRAALIGDGGTPANPAPVGVLHTPLVHATPMATASHEAIADAKLALALRDYDAKAAILRQQEMAALGMLREDGATGAYLQRPAYLADVKYIATNQIDLVEPLAFVGDFGFLAVGVRQDVRLIVDPYTFRMDENAIALYATLRADVVLLREDSVEILGTVPIG